MELHVKHSSVPSHVHPTVSVTLPATTILVNARATSTLITLAPSTLIAPSCLLGCRLTQAATMAGTTVACQVAREHLRCAQAAAHRVPRPHMRYFALCARCMPHVVAQAACQSTAAAVAALRIAVGCFALRLVAWPSAHVALWRAVVVPGLCSDRLSRALSCPWCIAASRYDCQSGRPQGSCRCCPCRPAHLRGRTLGADHPRSCHLHARTHVCAPVSKVLALVWGCRNTALLWVCRRPMHYATNEH